MRFFRLLYLSSLAALSACLAPVTQTAAPPGSSGSDLSAVDSPIVAQEEAGPKDVPTDVTSNQPGPGGSMPSGNPAPGNEWPEGLIRLNAEYQRICEDGSTGRTKIRLTGRVVSTWALHGHPEVCSFGGRQALRILFPTGTTRNPPLQFVDVPVAEDGGVAVTLSTTSPEGMSFYLKEKTQDKATLAAPCPGESCVDADQDGDNDDGFCAVISLEALGGSLTDVTPVGPVPGCQQIQIEKKGATIFTPLPTD